jgi:2-methylcitrate dehydratase PrpD
MALVLGRTRGAQAALRPADFASALASPAVCALSQRIRCVVDGEIEAGTNTEEVPSRVTLRLADGRTLVEHVPHPRGSPHRVMAWEELSGLFADTVSDALPAERVQIVLERVAALDRGARVRDITAAFIATPEWLERSTTAHTPRTPRTP